MKKANPNYIYLKEHVKNQRVTLLQGSTRSGKTYSVIYYLIWFCMKYKDAGIEIDIVRDTFTALKSTAWKDFKDVLIKHDLYNEKHHNKTDHIYNLFGNVITYYGADNPQKIHGRARDILWVNEAHQFPSNTVDQLFPRTRHRIICDYNPALGIDHWLDKYIEDFPPLITTYNDNPHLTKSQVLEIESRKKDLYWWTIYGTGKRAARQGVIFRDWEIGAFDESLPYIYGLDFGYEPDPSAFVRLAIDKKKKIIYIDELMYQTRLSTNSLYKNISKLIKRNKDLIIADSAEKREIIELNRLGLNVVPAVKGADSVRNGLRSMLDYKIVITKDSPNLKKELSNYIWNDSKSDTPIDDFNHLIDAARYAFTRLNKSSKQGVRRAN